MMVSTTAGELGRSPGELNRVAESNCAREPARQARQREPRLQTLCKRLQRHNRRTCGGAAKGSRGGWHRRRCVLRHPHRTPWVPNGTGQRCVGRNVVPEPYSLGYWQNGPWARVRRQGVAHCRPMDLRTRRKRKLLFLWEGGYRWPLDQWRNRNKTKQKILLPALHRGKERHCSRRLLRKSKLQHLRVACARAASSTSWTTWGLAGTRGAPHSCERLDAPAYVSIRPGAEQLWRTQEGAHGDGQTEAWPRGQRWMVHHAGSGCAGSPRSAAVPPRTAGRSPRRCRRTALPGRWGRRESVPCRRPSSLPGWARDGAPGPPWWTSPSRGTAPWLSSLVERSQSPCAAPASTPGRYYPRAPVWAPWLGEPAG